MAEKLITIQANPVFANVHECRKRYIAMKGSAGSGKSTDTAQMYILRLLTQPGRNLLCVRKTEESNRSSTFAELISAINRIGAADYFEYTVSPSLIRCRLNGNSVLFRGLSDDRQREKLKSITFPAGKLTDVWIEEATELEECDFEIIDDRLRGALPDGLFYQIKLTFNPVSSTHWLKKRFFDSHDDSVMAHSSTYLQNRFIDPEFHRRMERRKLYDPDGYRVYALGEWGVSGGQYFSEWRESVHVSDGFPIPPEWRRYLTVDYGLDMLAAYFIAVDNEGRAYVYNEVYESGLIISEAAKRIVAASDCKPYQSFAPPDLMSRRQDTGKSAFDIFAENGVELTKAQNDRVAGWLDLKEWLKPYKDEFGETRSSLTVFRTCENLIRTLPSVKRDPRNPNDVSREPHELTHAPDALRYFVAGRPHPAKGGGGTPYRLIDRLMPRRRDNLI